MVWTRAGMRAAIGLSLVLPLLACGGLVPIDGDNLTDALPISGGDEGAEGADEAEEEAPPPAPEELFAELDADEEPPGSPKCPEGSSVIRNPRGGSMHIYCATHYGKKNGPWTRWRGGRVVETRIYAEGLQGPSTAWEKTDDGSRKVLESHWLADVQDGDYAEWSPEGELLVRGVYLDGERHGRFIERTEDGSFNGVCYEAGTATWSTADPATFATDACGDDGSGDADSDEVASLE